MDIKKIIYFLFTFFHFLYFCYSCSIDNFIQELNYCDLLPSQTLSNDFTPEPFDAQQFEDKLDLSCILDVLPKAINNNCPNVIELFFSFEDINNFIKKEDIYLIFKECLKSENMNSILPLIEWSPDLLNLKTIEYILDMTLWNPFTRNDKVSLKLLSHPLAINLSPSEVGRYLTSAVIFNNGIDIAHQLISLPNALHISEKRISYILAKTFKYSRFSASQLVQQFLFRNFPDIIPMPRNDRHHYENIIDFWMLTLKRSSILGHDQKVFPVRECLYQRQQTADFPLP